MNQTHRASPRYLICSISCVASWLGISALLISPASAQVNGPGSSPSNLFDTVLNLPGDEAVTGRVIGGVSRQTTQLNVNDGGEVSTFFEARSGSEVNISGGEVGVRFDALSGSEVNISGGTVGSRFAAHDGSVVNIIGGFVGSFFDALSGSEVNIRGGEVSFGFDVNCSSVLNIEGGNVRGSSRGLAGSEINISGGTIGQLVIDEASEVNLSGGTVGPGFRANSGSVVNLLGSQFFIDGEELDTLVMREAFTITTRDVTLSGFLADGQQFSFDLNSTNPLDLFVDFFDRDATLTVTLVPPVILGDVNLNGFVDFDDIPAFIERLISGEFQDEADCDQNGVVDFSDIPAFIDILLTS